MCFRDDTRVSGICEQVRGVNQRTFSGKYSQVQEMQLLHFLQKKLLDSAKIAIDLVTDPRIFTSLNYLGSL